MKGHTDTEYKTISGRSRGKRRTGILVPDAKPALSSLKNTVAMDLGIDFTIEDKGSFTAKQCGMVGGEMVRRIIQHAKLELLNANPTRIQ